MESPDPAAGGEARVWLLLSSWKRGKMCFVRVLDPSLDPLFLLIPQKKHEEKKPEPSPIGTESSAVGDNDGAVQSANLSQAIRIQRQPCQNRIAGQFGRPIPAHTAHKQERPSPLPCASRSSRHPRSQMRSASVLAAGPIRTIRLPPVVAAQRRGPPGGYSSYPAHQVRSRRLGRRTHGGRTCKPLIGLF